MDYVTISCDGASGQNQLCLKEFARWRYQWTTTALVEFVGMQHWWGRKLLYTIASLPVRPDRRQHIGALVLESPGRAPWPGRP